MKLNLGDNIRELRRNRGWTQEQLAERVGMSPQAISRWENGTTYPDLELIPEIARLFSVTTDELLGCGEPKERLTRRELNRMAREAVKTNDPAKVIPILRLLRFEYREEIPNVLFNNMNVSSFLHSKEFSREYRLLVDDYLENGKNKSFQGVLIWHLLRNSDEAEKEEIIEKYGIADDLDLTESGLRRQWARQTKDFATFRKLSAEKRMNLLAKFLDSFGPILEEGDQMENEDPRYWREISEGKLGMLHALCRITPDGSHPVSGDGKLDLWANIRLDIGFGYGAQLAASGEHDLALTVLEDCADLLEQLTFFPDDEHHRLEYYAENFPLTCNAPDFAHIRGYRFPCYYRDQGKDTAEKRYSNILVERCYCGTCQFLYHNQLSQNDSTVEYDGFRSSWYDSIREHPRYQAVLERVRSCYR